MKKNRVQTAKNRLQKRENRKQNEKKRKRTQRDRKTECRKQKNKMQKRKNRKLNAANTDLKFFLVQTNSLIEEFWRFSNNRFYQGFSNFWAFQHDVNFRTKTVSFRWKSSIQYLFCFFIFFAFHFLICLFSC